MTLPRAALALVSAGAGAAIMALGLTLVPEGDHYRVTSMRPVAVAAAEGPDSMSVGVVVTWLSDSICSGQIRAVVEEEDDQILVGAQNWSYQGNNGACGGLGVDDDEVSAQAALKKPLGTRTIVDISSREPLPVRRPSP